MGDNNTKGELTPEKHPLPEALEKNKWVKGRSGNPAGRPEGSVSIVEGIKRKLMEIEPENKKTYLELFLNSYFRKAIKDKDSALIRDMINRIDGMPKQYTDLTTNGKDLPTPLLNGVHNNLSSPEATETES